MFSLETRWTSGTVVRKEKEREYGRGPEDDLKEEVEDKARSYPIMTDGL